MAYGTAYKRAELTAHWDAIVIGSGIGGLTAAVLLGLHGGKRVLVLEKHYEVGGFTHAFHRPQYEWDVGLHYLGQMQDKQSATRRMFDHVTRGQVQWHAMPEIYDRAIFGDQSFGFPAGREQFRDSLKLRFPKESCAIDGYFRAVLACNRVSTLYYAEKAIPGPAASLVGGLMRAPYMRWARRTTREVLESLTTDRELIGVLTAQWGDYGLPPGSSSFAIHATIVEHYMAGGSYPLGGASSIAAAMVPEIERSGGSVVTGAEVAEIRLDGAKAVGVRMEDAREFRADLVVSDAGAFNTFERLLPQETPVLDLYRAQLRNLEPSCAHVALYVGLSKSDAALGLRGTNLWVFPSLDHDANVASFARDIDAPFPVVYISFPSAKDPSFPARHPGKSTVEVISFLPYEAVARWEGARWKRRGMEYESLKERLTARLLAELERQVPAVAGNVALAEMSTPVSTRHFMNYSHGEIYGVAATPDRFRMRALGARTPIRGLYLTGQDVVSLGVVGALVGGVVSASAALGKSLFSAVLKART